MSLMESNMDRPRTPGMGTHNQQKFRVRRDRDRAYDAACERAAGVLLGPQAIPEPPAVAAGCASCDGGPLARGGMCGGCAHAVECHGARTETALEVECDGRCGRHRRVVLR